MPRLFLLTLFCLPLLSSCVAVGFQSVSKSPPPVRTPAFAAELAQVVKTPWTDGNAIRTLENGGNYFPAMLRAMGQAQKTITFESYVCVDSEPTQKFTQMFVERARAGVQVHVILDAFGCSKYGDAHLQAMRDAGVQLHLYRPMNLFMPWRFLHRTHRRVLVADGKIGFMGGAGWAYCWDGHAENVHRWRDTQYELRGPVVAQLQDHFNDNWQELTGHRLTGPDYYPPLPTAGKLKAQMAMGSPEKLGDTLGSSYLLAFRAAQDSIIIAHAYFIPNRPLRVALLEAMKRGVKVQIIIPGKHIDFPASRSVNTRYLRTLVAAGAELYEFQPTMTHGKLVVVDGHLSIAGSTNLDQRSFFINDENNLNVLDDAFSARQLDMIRRDREQSKRLHRPDLNLSLGRWFQGAFCRLFEYQM
ncbi:phospholipase D-like domain-containing protein [Prosthecobacter sp. SYSU 5D2]|uniref:phospholipase D-like domain-containing protein n=1 Tax=Prosthecobacter sp. SYSU 5D2 TaxID=3134134 RepID=UPI0031FF3DC3